MRMECADLDDIALRVGVVIPGPTPTLLTVVIWRCCISLLLIAKCVCAIDNRPDLYYRAL